MTKILAIDTSCDETSVAVTEGIKILANVIWSQASLHAKWGGVYPSLAKRAHEEHIDWTVQEALKKAQIKFSDLGAIAVTIGNGLAIALEVGIKKAKEIALQNNLPLIPISHTEGHLLSSLANKDLKINFPALGIVISGKHTDIILIKSIGQYQILAQTIDDALGEALDKGARMLGLGYPGGAILEKMARVGNPKAYNLPTPLEGQKDRMEFSFSGIKTAMYRLVEKETPLNKTKIENLASSFQDKVFQHFTNVFTTLIKTHSVSDVLFGGGVSSNIEIRKRLRRICSVNGATLHLPYSKKLCTDNAAMIGLVAFYKFQKGESLKGDEINAVERSPRLNV